MRIGHGYDVHAFGQGDHIMIGGVRVEHSHGVIAHSDGDVVIHALCDALLGAVALGDIGEHFPDTDSALKDISSDKLLSQTFNQVHEQGYVLGNADITVVAQAPRLKDHKKAMQARLAQILQCDVGQINIKATTTEKLGFEGRCEGIAAHAVVLLLAKVSQ